MFGNVRRFNGADLRRVPQLSRDRAVLFRDIRTESTKYTNGSNARRIGKLGLAHGC